MLGRTLVSRAVLLRNVQRAAEQTKQIKRNAGHGVWSYRVPPPFASKKHFLLSEFLGGLAWWWILYHLVTEPEHIYGEWPYVNPSSWTDEELGIPPDCHGFVPHLEQ